MIRRIIVEGADQQGKTTLCNLLAEKLGWNIIHFGKPTEDFDYMDGYTLPEKSISDRNYLSEIVYARINDREHNIPDVDLLETYFSDGDTILILMDRGEKFVFDGSRHEEYTEFQVWQAIPYYRTAFAESKLRKFTINPSCNCSQSNVDMLVELIRCSNGSV